MGKINLPHNTEYEKKLLGSLLITSALGDGRDYEPIYRIQDLIQPQDFYNPQHTAIYLAICSLAKEKKPIDLVGVYEKTTSQNKDTPQDSIGKLIGEIANSVVTSANCEYYAKEVKKYAERRKFIRICWEYSQLAEREESLDSVLPDFQNKLNQIHATKTEDLIHIKDFIMNVMDDISEQLSKRANGQESIPGIKTGLIDLDKKTGGFRPGNQVVIAARPGEGKTTLGEQICSHIAEQGNVIIFSYEMSREELGERLIQSLSGINIKKAASKGDGAMLLRTGDQIERLNIYIDDSKPTIDQLESRVMRISYEMDITAIMVDYLQLIPFSSRKNRYEAITDHSFRIKTLAGKVKAASLVISQLSRDSEKRAGKGDDFDRPKLSDLRESGAIEQDADIIFFLHRNKKKNDRGDINDKVELLCDKYRNGSPFDIKLFFDREHSRFECLAEDVDYWQDKLEDEKVPF